MSRLRLLLAVLLTVSLSTLLGHGAIAGASPAPSQGAESKATAANSDAQRMARPSVKLYMHPPIVQPGRKAASASKAKSAMTAKVKPGKKGKKVRLQRKQGGGWNTIAKRKTDRRGEASFAAKFMRKGKIAVYRAKVGRLKSKGVATNKWGAADFTDEFSGAALGANWFTRLQDYGHSSQRKCSKSSPSATKVGNGVVRLSVIDDPARPTLLDTANGTEKCRFEGKRYGWRLNGHIGTQGRQSLKYGYVAARMKFQARRGQHAAFWLQPESRAAQEGSPRKTGAEIDVIEYKGNNHPQGGLTSYLYYYPDNHGPGVTPKKVGQFVKKPKRYGRKWSKRYHVFSLEWTPKRYIFRIDGKETFRTSKGVSGRQQYLILSLLSSDYELEFLGGDDKLPERMSVDWVRFWER